MWNNIDFSKLNITFPFSGCKVSVINATKGALQYDIQEHMHSFYELHIIIEGRGSVTVDDMAHTLEKDLFFFTAPHITHAQHTDLSCPMAEYCLLLDISPNKKRSAEEIAFTAPLLDHDFSLVKPHLDTSGITGLLDAETSHSLPGQKELLTSLIKSLLVLFIRNLNRFSVMDMQPPVSHLTTPERRKYIIDSRMQFDCKNVSISSLAKELGISEKQTSRSIVKLYGMSFYDLRTRARLDNACTLLLSKDHYSIQTVSEWVGYASLLYFEKAFKARFHMTPTDYRKKFGGPQH